MDLPQLQQVFCRFPHPKIDDVAAETARILDESGLLDGLQAGARLAVATGSRGIPSIPLVIRAVVDVAKGRGLRPFILPAMGSHGGATAEGQTRVLADLGITPETVGAPIRADMETVEVGRTKEGLPVRVARVAMEEADAIILVNRLKAHTDFHGPYESGLVKMCVIGLGKKDQAEIVHGYGVRGLRDFIPQVAEVTLSKAPIIGGLALIENAYKELAHIEALPNEEILTREPQLLVQAKELMPRLPLPQVDVLICDLMGKDISGAGMDTNIVGRLHIFGEQEPDRPLIRRLAVLDLTESTHGNAAGIGLADLTTDRLVDKIDYEVTWINSITSAFLERAAVPIHLPNDRQVIETAIRTCHNPHLSQVKLVRIHSTAQIHRIAMSAAAIEAADMDVEVGGPLPWSFDDQGNLTDIGQW